MKEQHRRILQLECPDTEGMVSFLDAHTNITCTLDGGKLFLKVTAKACHDSDIWDEHYFEVELPRPEVADEPCYGWVGPADHLGEFQQHHEHGKQWVTCIACGAQWSVEGDDDLEEVSEGDGHCADQIARGGNDE